VVAFLVFSFKSHYRIAASNDEFRYDRKPMYDQWHWQVPVAIVVGEFMIYGIVATIFPLPQWLCWLLLRRRTSIRFSRDLIVVDGREWEIPPNQSVNFYASRNPIPEGSFSREHHRVSEYLRGFRLLEMSYGQRNVKITTFDTEAKADDFVIALQYAMAEAAKSSAPHTPISDDSGLEESLPE
jgi:hypothetical protein